MQKRYSHRHPPQNPCTNLKAIINQILSTKIIPILANVNNAIATINGVFRPIESDIGPTNKLPNAKPIINKDKVSCELDVVVLKSDCICGKPGKNISIDNAPIAVNAPKIITNSKEFLCCS